MAPTTTKDKFVNKSAGYLGVIQLDARGERSSIAIAPDQEVWLSEEEQALTANAPRDPANNPLANGDLKLEAEGVELKHHRPLRPPAVPVEEQETGAAPAPAGDAAEGTRPAGEEVGTPDVAEQAERETAVKENVEAAAVSGRQRSRAKAA